MAIIWISRETFSGRIRVIANQAFRVGAALVQHNLAEPEALGCLARVDPERRGWTRFLFGAAWEDPGRSDAVLNPSRVSLDTAAETVVDRPSAPPSSSLPSKLSRARRFPIASWRHWPWISGRAGPIHM